MGRVIVVRGVGVCNKGQDWECDKPEGMEVWQETG